MSRPAADMQHPTLRGRQQRKEILGRAGQRVEWSKAAEPGVPRPKRTREAREKEVSLVCLGKDKGKM